MYRMKTLVGLYDQSQSNSNLFMLVVLSLVPTLFFLFFFLETFFLSFSTQQIEFESEITMARSEST